MNPCLFFDINVFTYVCVCLSVYYFLSPMKMPRPQEHPSSNENNLALTFWFLNIFPHLKGEMSDSRAGIEKVLDEL